MTPQSCAERAIRRAFGLPDHEPLSDELLVLRQAVVEEMWKLLECTLQVPAIDMPQKTPSRSTKSG